MNKNNLTLREQRDNVREAMKTAFAKPDMPEYHRLNRHLEWLEEEIKKEKT